MGEQLYLRMENFLIVPNQKLLEKIIDKSKNGTIMAVIQRFNIQMRGTGQGFFARTVFRELPAGVRKQRGKELSPASSLSEMQN